MGQDPDTIRREIEQTREHMGETVDALGYKADVPTRAREKVSDTKDRVVGAVTGRMPDTDDATGQAKAKARRARGVARENPLGLALGGVAVGFLAGLLVPHTRVEDDKLGPTADSVKDRVKETGQEALERGKQVATDAAQSAKETAQESGREHAEQLRDSGQERAREAQQEVRS